MPVFFSSFFFNDTATTEIYTLSLHDALPIWRGPGRQDRFSHRKGRRAPGHSLSADTVRARPSTPRWAVDFEGRARTVRSEEHTSELQSHSDLVCRLLLEKKKTTLQPDMMQTR